MLRILLVVIIAVVGFAAWNKKRPADPAVAAVSAQRLLKTYTLTEVDAGYSEAVLHGWRVLVSKQLEGGAFRWPPVVDGAVRLTSVEFAALFDGIDWTRVQAPKRIPTPAAAA